MTEFVLTPARGGGYVACDPVTGTTSQGDDIAQALANLREAVDLYCEEFPKLPDFSLG